MKDGALGFGMGLLFILGLYFFYFLPEKNKAFDEGYKKGLELCEAETDTSPPVIEYRDTSFSSKQPVEVEESDTSLTLITSDDTSFISGKDSLKIQSTVVINLEKKNGKWNAEIPAADWFHRIEHRDYEIQPDTIIIKQPKFVEIIKEEVNWLITGLAYLGGILTAIGIFVMAGI